MTFLIGQKFHVADITTQSDTDDPATVTFTQTTYTLERTSVIFQVPSSGVVEIEIIGDLWATSSSDNAYLAWGISGTDTIAPTDSEALRTHGSSGIRTKISSIVSGLTPYANDQISLYMRCDSGSGANVLHTRVIVRPA